jgi:hypothetical protein
MQIQIQNVDLSTISNSKNTGKLLNGAPMDFCSENLNAHFFQPLLVFQHSLGSEGEMGEKNWADSLCNWGHGVYQNLLLRNAGCIISP